MFDEDIHRHRHFLRVHIFNVPASPQRSESACRRVAALVALERVARAPLLAAEAQLVDAVRHHEHHAKVRVAQRDLRRDLAGRTPGGLGGRLAGSRGRRRGRGGR